MSSYFRIFLLALVASCGFDPHGLLPDAVVPPEVDSSVDTSMDTDAMVDASTNPIQIMYFRMASELVNGTPMVNGRADHPGTAQWSADADQCLASKASANIPEWTGSLTEGTTGSRVVSQPEGLGNALTITCKRAAMPDATSILSFCAMRMDAGAEMIAANTPTHIEWFGPSGTAYCKGISDPVTGAGSTITNGGGYAAQQRIEVVPTSTVKQGVTCYDDGPDVEPGTSDDDRPLCTAWVNFVVN